MLQREMWGMFVKQGSVHGLWNVPTWKLADKYFYIFCDIKKQLLLIAWLGLTNKSTQWELEKDRGLG